MRISRGWLVAFLLQATVLIGCSQYPLKEARNHELAGNDEAALHSYQRALAKTPKNDRHGRSIFLTSMGKCLYRMDRFPEAFAAFKKAAEADGTNSEAHLRLGKMLLEAGSAEGAREEALQVLNSAGNNNDALALLGAAWAAADNPAMAKAVYQRVLKSDPKQVKVAVALADIYNEEDDREEARGSSGRGQTDSSTVAGQNGNRVSSGLGCRLLREWHGGSGLRKRESCAKRMGTLAGQRPALSSVALGARRCRFKEWRCERCGCSRAQGGAGGSEQLSCSDDLFSGLADGKYAVVSRCDGRAGFGAQSAIGGTVDCFG